MKDYNIFSSCIFLILFHIFNTIIIIPFETYNPLISRNPKLLELVKNASDEILIDTIFKNLIYINLEIGENIQTIPTFIEMGTDEFYLKDLMMKDIYPFTKNSIYKNFTFNDNFLLTNFFQLNYYNSSLSKAYKYVTSCPEYLKKHSLDRDICANDTLYFRYKNSSINEEIKKPITFYLTFKGFEKNDHRPGIIGLYIKDSEFILKLKQYSVIDKYVWNFKYTNNSYDKGELIIGDFPHIYDKNNYKVDNLRNAKIIIKKDLDWILNFENIFITINKNKKEEHLYLEKNGITATFCIDEFFILASEEYFKIIEELFFKKYIDEGICNKKTHKKKEDYHIFFHYFCYIKNKNKKDEFFNNFPSLTFYQKEMNYNFTLDYKDLFTIIPDNYRILFNIESYSDSKNWVFGKPFFKKYQLIFDSDSKIISYYINDNLEKNSNSKFVEKEKTKKIIIIVLIILAFIIGIFFGKIICSKYNRKIRANELEDRYSYISKDNDLKNINLKNENFISDYKIIK